MVPYILNVDIVVCCCTLNIQASPDYVTVRASTIKVPANIAQRISGTDISERCVILSNRYTIAPTKTPPPPSPAFVAASVGIE